MTDNQHGDPNAAPTEERIALRDDSNGDWKKANDRYFNLVEQNRGIQDEVKQIKEMLPQLMEGGRVNPNARSQDRSALGRLESEYALPADLTSAAIREIAESEIAKAFKPLAEGMAARSRAVEKFGQDFVSNEAEMLKWINTDSDASETYSALMMAGKPDQAYNVGWRLYAASKSAALPPNPDAEAVSRRNAATLPPNASTASRNASTTRNDKERFEDMVNEYRQSKDLRPVATEIWRGKPLTWAEHIRALVQEGNE